MLKQTLLALALPLLLGGADREISVVTVNLAKEASVPRMVEELRATAALWDSDVVLLQEAAGAATEGIGAKLRLHAVSTPAAPGVSDHLAILSRYPLRDVRTRELKRFDLVFHSRPRFALTAIADTPMGAVRIVNAHLDTRLNTSDRLAQLDGVLGEGGAGAAIVGGDFNSNPFYWIDHVIPLPAIRSQAFWVEEYMTRAGYGAAIPRAATTFDYLGMHLDWIWLRGLRATASGVYPLKFSDHHACWARISF